MVEGLSQVPVCACTGWVHSQVGLAYGKLDVRTGALGLEMGQVKLLLAASSRSHRALQMSSTPSNINNTVKVELD